MSGARAGGKRRDAIRRSAHPDSDRREPRNRARHREALLERGLARDHLLATPLSRGLSLGGRAGRPCGHRPRRPRKRGGGRGGDARAPRRAAPARARQQRGDFAQGRVGGSPRHDRYRVIGVATRLRSEFLRSPRARASPGGGASRRPGLHPQRHFNCRRAGAPLRRLRLRHLQGGARRPYPRDGGGFRSSRNSRQRHRSRRDPHRHPLAGGGEARRRHPHAPPGVRGRSRVYHLLPLLRPGELRQRHRDPHQRRPARRSGDGRMAGRRAARVTRRERRACAPEARWQARAPR